MTLFNTTPLHAGRWCRGMSLASSADDPGSRRTEHGVIAVIFLLLRCFVFFALFFPNNG